MRQQVGERLLEVLVSPILLMVLSTILPRVLALLCLMANQKKVMNYWKRADIAMYSGKAGGGSSFVFLIKRWDKVSYRAALSADLLVGIREEQFHHFINRRLNILVADRHRSIDPLAAPRAGHGFARRIYSGSRRDRRHIDLGILGVEKPPVSSWAVWANKPAYAASTVGECQRRQFYQSDFAEKVLLVL